MILTRWILRAWAPPPPPDPEPEPVEVPDGYRLCPKCGRAHPLSHFSAPAKGLGEYDGYRRGICTDCQVKHHASLLSGKLDVVLSGVLLEETVHRYEILLEHQNALRDYRFGRRS